MNIQFSIGENDFLAHQLYVASQSDSIRKKRLRSRLLVPLLYLGFGALLLADQKAFPSMLFLVFAILWYFLYPFWEKQRYVKHYRNFIRENYKDRLGKTASLDFSHTQLHARDNGSESTVQCSEIEEIVEIPSNIFIRLKGGQSIILPKDGITGLDHVIDGLKELAQHLKIRYQVDLNWKWK